MLDPPLAKPTDKLSHQFGSAVTDAVMAHSDSHSRDNDGSLCLTGGVL